MIGSRPICVDPYEALWGMENFDLCDLIKLLIVIGSMRTCVCVNVDSPNHYLTHTPI